MLHEGLVLEGIKRQTFKRTQNRHIKVNRHVSVEPDKFASSRNKTINAPKNVRYKRSTKVARARKVVERSLLSSKGPEAPVLHEGRARARARARAR